MDRQSCRGSQEQHTVSVGAMSVYASLQQFGKGNGVGDGKDAPHQGVGAFDISGVALAKGADALERHQTGLLWVQISAADSSKLTAQPFA